MLFYPTLEKYQKPVRAQLLWDQDHSSYGSVAVIRYSTQDQLGEQRVYFSSYFQVIVHHWGKLQHKLKEWMWKLELKQRAWRRRAAYWLASHVLLSLLAYTIQVRSTHIILCLPISDVNQENSPQTCSQTNLMEGIPSMRSLLPKYV